MKLGIYLGLGFACLAEAAAPEVIPPRLPIENFSTSHNVGNPALSPDGQTIAYEINRGDGWVLALQDWATGKIVICPYNATGGDPTWLSNERILYGRGASVDRNGKNGRYPEYMPKLIAARFSGAKPSEFLGVEGTRHHNVIVVNTLDELRPDIQFSRRRVANPGNVIGWMVDGTGFVRAAVEEDEGGGKTRVIVRANEAAPWVVPKGLDFANDKIRAHWLSADGRLLYFSRVTPEGTWGVYSYDLEKQQEKELIIGHTKFDILPDGAPFLAPKTREILGFYYVTDKLRVIWFDPQMGAVQAALDQILPHRTNTITSVSDDLQRMIVLSWSARDPGVYYRFDLEKKELKPVLPKAPWIRPAQMADCFPISYRARDGQLIHGYLTLPTGRGPKDLPLVVYPHDFPWERDQWVYDPQVQLLANRGYAVLQVNYRGSSGYGPSFQESAYRRIGREMQDDITDGTRWTIEQGISDPHRIAILGFGFGGYLALRAAEQNPQLYHCAISVGGRTDWTIKKEYWESLDDIFKQRIGDPEKDAVELADNSPVNHVGSLQAPLLLIFTDWNVLNVYNPSPREDYDYFRAFTKALDQAKKPYEVLDKHMAHMGSDDMGNFSKTKIELLTRIDQFLSQHMPMDVSAQPPPTAK